MTENTGRTRRQAQTAWNVWASGPTTVARISDLESGATYEIQVRQFFDGHAPSEWSEIVEMETT